MTWLTWRQFRVQAITAAAALAAFAILLAVTGPRIASLYATSGITGCHGDTCAGLASHFLIDLTSGRGFPLLPDGTNAYVILYFLSVLVILAAPAIIGICSRQTCPARMPGRASGASTVVTLPSRSDEPMGVAVAVEVVADHYPDVDR